MHILAAVLFVAFAAVLGADGFKRFRLAKAASLWPSTFGRVVKSELEDGPLRGRLIRIASHRAAVTYTYEVAGREFTGNRVFFGDEMFATGDDARDRVRKYEPNSTLLVFYDPADPARAVLEPQAAWSKAVVSALTWVGLMILSLAVVAIFSRRR